MEGHQLRILHLEANPGDAKRVESTLHDGGIDAELVRVQTRDQLVDALTSGRFDLVLADYALPGLDGMDAMQIVTDRHGGRLPFLFITSQLDDETAVEAIKKGAVDCVPKSCLSRLPRAVERALHESDERRQRQRAEEALSDSEQRFCTLTEAMPEIVWTADPQGQVDYCNPRWQEYTGLSSDAAYGLGWKEALHPDDRPHVLAAREESMRTAQPLGIEHRLRGKDGSYRWFLTKALPMKDEHGRLTKWLGTSTDIHGQKVAQDQLQQVNELLEERVEERTRSLVEHQEQLRAMASDLTLTEQRERRRLASELHDYLAQLLVACKMKTRLLLQAGRSPRGEALVSEMNDLLEQSIKYTRTLIAELSPTILYEAGLPAAIRWLGEQMQRHGLRVDVEEDSGSVTMPDDQAVLIFQAVRELLLNVARHAMAYEATVSIKHATPDRLTITVTDQGIGFDVPKAEEPATVGKYGLFSIRERLEALGGRFDVASGPGQGTRAMLTVPLRAAVSSPELLAAEPAVSRSPVPVHVAGRATTRRRITRVLLVDDHHMVREGLRSLIESEPRLRVVGEASNGEEALQQARILHPDVVVMDINMPKLNGIEATRRLKEELPSIAVVALSMHEDKSMIAAMKQAGAVACIAKGGASEDLSRAIREAHFSTLSLAGTPG